MKKTLYDANEPKKIGMLTPSSNTALEPICSRMVSGLEEQVTMHYSRLEVTAISMGEDALKQFGEQPFLHAASYLAHADVDAIAWNGTAGGWLGLDYDERLCEKITEATGIPTTTSMLALLDAFEKAGVKSCHLVTPYLPDVYLPTAEQFEKRGIRVPAVRGLSQTVNRSFSRVPPEEIRRMCSEVCEKSADAIAIICTNLRTAWQVPALEEEFKLPVFDSTAVTVWKTLEMVGISPNVVQGFGKLFSI